MKRKLLLFVCFFASVSFAFCQENEPTFSLPNYDPPSPEAASLGKFVDHPVGKFTGTPEIDIPLFDLKVGRIDLPISLSYHGSGVKVNEVASRVGTSWALNAGGVVTRTVKGFPDDIGISMLEPGGITVSESPYFLGGSTQTDASIFMEDDQSAILTELNDLEPDEYFYNFAGKQGKMYFSDPTHPLLTNDAPLKVTGPFSGANSFVIIDEQGIVYTFQNTETSNISHTTTGVDPTWYNFTSSWFLSQIYDPVTNETVTFQYRTNLPNLNYSYVNSVGDPGPCDAGYPQNSTAQVTITQSQVLSKIVYNGGYIQFDATQSRIDLNGDVAYTKISQYVTSGTTTTLLKGYNLAYINTTTGSGVQEGQRMYLNTVQEFGSDGSLSSPYTFAYKNTNTLPDRNSLQQDIWGYYNANGVTTTTPQLPKVFVHNHGTQNDYLPFNTNNTLDPPTQTISGLDLSSNVATVDAGTLNKITYPTGGYTIYTYEINQFSSTGSLYPATYSGGGVRIKEIDDYSTSNQWLLSRTYQYTNGFLGGPLPQVAYSVGSGASPFRYSLNQTVLGSCQGSYVGYGQVTEIQASAVGANNGNTIYTYTTDQDVPGTFSEITNYCLDPSTVAAFRAESYFPFFEMESRENRRGLLTQQISIDAIGNPRHSIYYNYNLISIPLITVNSSYLGFNHPINGPILTTENLHQTRVIRMEKELLVSTTENEYDGSTPAQQAPSVSNLINYTYCGGHNNDQFVRTKQHFDSRSPTDPFSEPNQNSSDTTYYYPFDYSPTTASGGIMGTMVTMNYISPVISKISFVQKYLNQGSYTKYYTSGQINDYMHSPYYTDGSMPNSIVPKQVFVLNLAAPIQQPNAGVEVADPSNPGSLYDLRLQYLHYDINANPWLIQHDNQYEEYTWSPYNQLLTNSHTTNISVSPVSSQTTTYTYDALLRLSSITDPGNKIRTFEYDAFSRLMNIKDNTGSIISHTDYHYQGQ